MKVVHFSNDLMMVSTVRSAAVAAGVEFILVGNHEQLNAIGIAHSQQVADVQLFVDLQDKQLLAEQLCLWVETHRADLSRIVLYAQHVNEETLSSARAWGVGDVITRGQFFRQVGTLVRG